MKNPALQWWGQQAEKGGVMSEIRTISDESLAQAVEIVRDGGLIVIPTDTVYGVACDPRNIEAIRKVFAAKQRPKYKSLQVLLPSIESMEKLHLDLPVPLNRLSAMFMPGAFSPIAVADDDCTLATVRTDPATGKVTQGVRIPNSTAALRVLRATGPLAATSANRSGDESAQTVDEAVQALGDAVDLYLDGGATPGHVASTVVAADPHGRDGIAILREGVIHEPVIRKALTLNGGALGV
ncbi:Sua5/YciO/YrdC/YwlC family protein [Bifidobacterium pseudocatenulatum DSM 20438 = JCM 1200 = LMG 10505]|uniref:L-threonylcarbamoyladenylate synthase n=3 Tax=Bifidobacterium pseudocatenulatum TaxID=28026 RepID=C0BQ15_BIFPS|nr:Sua5/YciO/YrdC/YwlC family protein [Bifidobacterium pseudocatenulatum DSM 20438 = JCM 1200 = LMG 10505]